MDLKQAIVNGLKQAKKDGLVSCRSYPKTAAAILAELAKLGTGKLGEVEIGAGRAVDPYDVVSMLARGVSSPSTIVQTKSPRPPKTPKTIPVSDMIGGLARFSKGMDEIDKADYQKFEYFDQNYHESIRLAWELGIVFGVYIIHYHDDNHLVFCGSVQVVKTCKMILNLLVEKLASEIEHLSSDKKEAFYQQFGQEVCKEEGKNLDEIERIRAWYKQQYNEKIVPAVRLTVSERLKKKAVSAASKITLPALTQQS